MPKNKESMSKVGVIDVAEALQLQPYIRPGSCVRGEMGNSRFQVRSEFLGSILRGSAVRPNGLVDRDAIQAVQQQQLHKDLANQKLQELVQLATGTASDFMQFFTHKELQSKEDSIISPRITPTTPKNYVPTSLKTWVAAINASEG